MRILMFADLALYHHIFLLVALWMTGYQVINARTYTGTTEYTIVNSYQKDPGQSKVMLRHTVLDHQLRSSTAVHSIATSILA